MPPPANPTVGQHLAWAYANLAMAEMAVHDGAQQYGRLHYMIRARTYAGLVKGTMSPRSMMRDQRIRMKLPQQCIYCGCDEHLAVDHVVPKDRGGAESGDNAVWSCRRCNSSKSGRDLFEWWAASRPGLPPLFVIRVYLKQAIAYARGHGLDDLLLDGTGDHPYRFDLVPVEYPPPADLIFTPFHAAQAASQS